MGGNNKPLAEWIQHMEKSGVSLCKNKGLVVIVRKYQGSDQFDWLQTVIGKDTSSSTKISDLNDALGGSYLSSWGQRDLNCGSVCSYSQSLSYICYKIDAFFSFDLEALFLVVNSYKDVSAFASVSSSSNKVWQTSMYLH